MRRGALLGIVVLLAAIALPSRVSAETRIALVIGNGAYPSGPLGSPKKDADAVAKKLSELGFAVTKETNIGGPALRTAIRDFGHRLEQPDTVGLFYYSGHGMQVNNRNYMIPIDAEIRDEADVEESGVAMEHVLRRMEHARSNPNIIILDACRDNPFEKAMKSAQTGLAPMRPPTSTLIAFAAAPGTVAQAASGGRLSPYTESLLEYIDTPGQDLIKMFQVVQNTVWQRSQGRQNPHVEFTPGLPDFSFKPVMAALPGVGPATPPARAPAVQPAAPVLPKVGESFKDCDVCPEMVVVPAGSFLMGSPEGEEGRFDNEGPQHRVTIANPFALDKYEVTFDEWDACAARGGCNGYRPDDQGWGRGKRPVINVSWRDAQAFVAWLSKATGKGYRLPTEAEWEYACRAGRTTLYSWGDAITQEKANYRDALFFWSNPSMTTEVGDYPLNRWGLSDMHGNVGEWVEDIWHENYRGASRNGLAWTEGEGVQSESYRVFRGGSWLDFSRGLRSAYRNGYRPDRRGSNLGFRVARTLD